ncbi:lamin tail domain-containing protein [Candidatus Pacearchaeota archaeon]|nr:lamin tail domain-containing protein [Candidatus Pacearchaeota archaeon]
MIEIEIRNPEKEIVDQITIEHQITDEFCSYKRADNEWKKSDQKINLKEGLAKTFATPHAPNELPIEEQMEGQADEQIEEPTEGQIEEQIVEQAEPQPSPQLAPPLDPQLGPPLEIYKNHQLINEIMVNPVGKDTEGEWIELFNNTSELIDLSDWYLDDAEGNSSPHKLENGTMIGPGARIIIKEPDLGLSLKNSTDEVRLLDPNKELKERIVYAEAKEDWSYSKKADGTFEWTPIITPYMTNQFPEPPKSYSSKIVTFSNVIPNPTGKDENKEKITFKNHSHNLIDLSQWKLGNKKGKTVNLSEVFLEPYAKITINPTESGLTLVNKADELTLIDPIGNAIDQISWEEAKDDQIIFPNNFFKEGMKVMVTQVIDGDTISAIINNETYSIRLIGVDTPETVHPFEPIEKYGKEASDFLNRTIANKNVTLYFDEEKTDRYNRILAYVHYDGDFINVLLIQKGLGSAYTRFPFKYLDNFVKYEQEAKNNGMGIWSEYETIKFVEDLQENEEEMTEEEEIESIEEMVEVDHDPPIECPTEGLVIETILPNAEKGISTEFIRIKNNSDQKICLTGWQLDDNVVKGSKPFIINGGAIASGGFRTFRKAETKISLNNSNDCATLINPKGEVVDQICYNKTHKNETFTHDGGDWKPKRKILKSGLSSPRSKTPKPPTRDTIAYQWDLKNEELEGEIVFIYEEGELLYLKKEGKTIPVSYAGSDFNIHMSRQLLDFKRPVAIQARTAGTKRQLISMSQGEIEKNKKTKEKTPTEVKYWSSFFIAIILMLGWRYIKKKTFFM